MRNWRKISVRVRLDKGERNIVDELKDEVEKDPKAKMSLSDFIRWLDPRPREEEEESSVFRERLRCSTTTTTTNIATRNTTSVSKPKQEQNPRQLYSRVENVDSNFYDR